MSKVARKKPDEPVVEPIARVADRLRLKNSGEVYETLVYLVAAGTTVAELQEPSFWRPVVKKIRPWTRIDCLHEEGEFLVELLVLAVTENTAFVHLLREVKLPGVGVHGASPRAQAGVSVTHQGVHRGWAVSLGDRLLRDGFRDENEARRWLANWTQAQERRHQGDAT